MKKINQILEQNLPYEGHFVEKHDYYRMAGPHGSFLAGGDCLMEQIRFNDDA